MKKQQENLEHYIELVESMRMPDPLTAGFSLDSEERSKVERCVEDVHDKGLQSFPIFWASSVWNKCVSDWSRYLL